MAVEYSIRKVTIEDYDRIFALWNSTEQSRRALNPVDDSREGIRRYLERNPNTCFAAVAGERIIGVILTGHDGRRATFELCDPPRTRGQQAQAQELSRTLLRGGRQNGIIHTLF